MDHIIHMFTSDSSRRICSIYHYTHMDHFNSSYSRSTRYSRMSPVVLHPFWTCTTFWDMPKLSVILDIYYFVILYFISFQRNMPHISLNLSFLNFFIIIHLDSLYNQQLLLFVLKCLYHTHLIPSIFCEYFIRNSQIHAHSTRIKSHLHI